MAINPLYAVAAITTSGTSAQAGVTFNQGRYWVVATVAAWLKVGANPTAVAAAAGNIFLPAGVPIEIVVSDPTQKIAAIQDAAAGKVVICPVV